MRSEFKYWNNHLPYQIGHKADVTVHPVPEMLNFASVDALVRELKPRVPVHCIRPQVLQQVAQWFLDNFPGDVLYAVKCNPEPAVLHHLSQAGIRHFDVTSLSEIKLISKFAPGGTAYFMHPVKSRDAIRKAYFDYGVRDFALDSKDELQKIIEETGSATDLNLHIRLALPKGVAAHDLSGKFGAHPDLTVELLQAADKIARQVGICFHVGSQCLHPDAYRRAIKLAAQVIARSGIEIDIFNLGGGFPAVYPGMTPPPMSRFMDAIKAGLAEDIKLPAHTKVRCEPGRALVAEAGSVLVNVELRKGDNLYINDGVYGSLFDAGILNMRYPAKLIRGNGSEHKTPYKGFKLYGPTCDTVDVMRGPYLLPEDTTEGDWIELGQLGAYCTTMRSKFNGFDEHMTVEVWDQPQMQMKDWQPRTDRRTIDKDNVPALNLLALQREAYETEMS